VSENRPDALPTERLNIIRRAPTGAIPIPPDPATVHFRRVSTPPSTKAAHPNGATAIAAAAVSIVSGWATAVIATDLITGWWRTDRLFCVAVAFLTAISASATTGGLIVLLLRQRLGRILIVVGCVVALLVFAGLFVTNARISPVVYAIPVLPLGAIVLTLLPSTRRWTR
jgi:hypothetical protein